VVPPLVVHIHRNPELINIPFAIEAAPQLRPAVKFVTPEAKRPGLGEGGGVDLAVQELLLVRVEGEVVNLIRSRRVRRTSLDVGAACELGGTAEVVPDRHRAD